MSRSVTCTLASGSLSIQTISGPQRRRHRARHKRITGLGKTSTGIPFFQARYIVFQVPRPLPGNAITRSADYHLFMEEDPRLLERRVNAGPGAEKEKSQN